MPYTRSRPGGFTILEMAIVIIVIGLIIGAIFVGRDLIMASQVRQVGALIGKVDSAVNTFKLKYNCLPGDCANGTDYGFPANGNGDGAIYSTDGDGAGGNGLEPYLFWQELIDASLVPDQRYCMVFLGGANCGLGASHGYWFYGAYSVPGYSNANMTFSPMIQVINVADWLAQYPNTSGYTVPFQHIYAFNWSSRGSGVSIFPPIFTSQLDTKFDDGLPLSGSIMALIPNHPGGWGDDSTFVQNGSTSLSCMNRTTTPYMYQSGTSSRAGCAIIWRAGF